jgi:hypothetical protein
MRTKLQAISDRLLLLRAIAKGNEVGNVDGTFKLMKIPFMAELASTRRGINTFNYSFYRWTFGPFTTEIYEDADALTALGLSTDKRCPRVTDKGVHLLKMASGLFAENRKVIEFVDAASSECAPLSFGALKAKVYKEEILAEHGTKCTIAQASTGWNVLSAIPKPSAAFTIGDDWVDTLWSYFNYSDEELDGLKTIRPMLVPDTVLQ